MTAQLELALVDTRFCPCGYLGWEHGAYSLAWEIAHKDAHLAAFPNVDARTVQILDEEIERTRRLMDGSYSK